MGAAKFSIMFSTEADTASVDKMITNIQKKATNADFKITPTIDDKAITQMQKSLQTTIDKTTQLKKLTSSFTQDGINYNVSQTETSKGQYSAVQISADYTSAIGEAKRQLQSLYVTARETQDQINNAIKNGVTSTLGTLRSNLAQTEEQIEQVKERYTLLQDNPSPRDTTRFQRYEGVLENGKLMESASAEVQQMKQLDVVTEKLIDSSVRLAKAKATLQSADNIDIIQS